MDQMELEYSKNRSVRAGVADRCARSERASMRGGSREPRGTAALPVCTAPRSSLKISQPHGRQRDLSTARYVAAVEMPAYRATIRRPLRRVFLVEQSRPP